MRPVESREYVAVNRRANDGYAHARLVEFQVAEKLNDADSQADEVDGEDIESKLPQDGVCQMNRGGLDDDRAFTSEGIRCDESSLRMLAEHKD